MTKTPARIVDHKVSTYEDGDWNDFVVRTSRGAMVKVEVSPSGTVSTFSIISKGGRHGGTRGIRRDSCPVEVWSLVAPVLAAK